MKIRIVKISSKIFNPDMPDGYWVEGMIEHIPIIGEFIWVYRTANSVKGNVSGVFRTSQIVSITEKSPSEFIFETANSGYSLTILDESIS